MTQNPDQRTARPRLLTWAGPLVALAILGLAWHFVDLSMLSSPERVAEAARSLRANRLAVVYVALGFALGTLLFLPVTALMAGTVLAFGPLQGFLYALIGGLVGSSVTYAAGRLTGSAALDYFSGPRLTRLKDELQTRALRASIIARLLPVGNFTVINMIAGSLRIPFRAFFLGNVIGIVPGLAILTLFADQLSALARSPDLKNIALAVGAVLLVVALLWLTRHLARRRERQVRTGEGAVP